MTSIFYLWKHSVSLHSSLIHQIQQQSRFPSNMIHSVFLLCSEHFPDSSSSAAVIRLTEETDDTGAPRKKHPDGGKKGRRRKGHKKKIKRIKPVSSWNSNTPTAAEEDQINSSLTSVTKLSLNESEQQQKQQQQNQKPGRKKHRQKSSSQPTAGGGSKRKMTTTTKKSSFRSGRRDENWARKAGQELVVLNSDDIYDGNMQITVQRDATSRVAGDKVGDAREMGNLSDEGDSRRQHQKDQQPRKLTPAERRQKKLEKQRKQLKKFNKGRWNSFSSC